MFRKCPNGLASPPYQSGLGEPSLEGGLGEPSLGRWARRALLSTSFMGSRDSVCRTPNLDHSEGFIYS